MGQEKKKKTTYKDAGVDIDAGNEVVKRIKQKVASTFRPEVLSEIGGFGALFSFDKDKYKEPVLVSSTDGVGTKVKIAFMADKHDSIGIDLVAMCVNDVLVQGAEPLFFLDYLATGRVEPGVCEQIVSGIAQGCKMAGCALVGGETAEMPSMYQQGEYDLAGFTVGVVDKEKLVTGQNIQKGDVLLGIASSGIHSNGYSLVREIVFKQNKLSVNDKLLDSTAGEILLTPTKIYVKTILSLLEKVSVKGMAHITGGGLYENIERIIPQGLSIEIDKNSWPILPIFKYLQDQGNVEEKEMFRVFNMGIGFVLVVSPDHVNKAQDFLVSKNEKSYVIGKVC